MLGIPDESGRYLKSFLRARVDESVELLEKVSLASLRAATSKLSISDSEQANLIRCLSSDEFLQSEEVVGFDFGTEGCLVCSAISVQTDLCIETFEQSVVIAVLPSPVGLACAVLRNALETWTMKVEVQSSQTALEDSAIQLAQSFEEQNWLRGYARNSSNLTKITNPNDVAEGILQPLGYILRSEGLYLIVDPVETEKSGLTSAKFGQSNLPVESVRQSIESLGIGHGTPPLVRNNLPVDASDSQQLSSVVAVSVSNGGDPFGYIVAINRSVATHESGLPVYDPEFGSGDVGLLEEAAVLLTTQAQNMHLLLQSNQLFLGTLHSMSSAIDARDKYTQGHSERVARLSFDLAKILGLSNEACQEIYLSGILHDIGKIGIPDRVLLKPGKLDDDEFAVIRQHPEIGYRIVEQLGHLQFVLPGVLHHHERWDGKGYPHGLAGLSIPLMARIMAVADAFDAMTSSRPYRHAMPVEKARSIILDGAASQWDAEVVNGFSRWLATREQEEAPINQPVSIIPQDSPMDYLAQAVMTLVH